MTYSYEHGGCLCSCMLTDSPTPALAPACCCHALSCPGALPTTAAPQCVRVSLACDVMAAVTPHSSNLRRLALQTQGADLPSGQALYDLPLGWWDPDWAGCSNSRAHLIDSRWMVVAHTYLAINSRWGRWAGHVTCCVCWDVCGWGVAGRGSACRHRCWCRHGYECACK
jgi:hypothetical protein